MLNDASRTFDEQTSSCPGLRRPKFRQENPHGNELVPGARENDGAVGVLTSDTVRASAV